MLGIGTRVLHLSVPGSGAGESLKGSSSTGVGTRSGVIGGSKISSSAISGSKGCSDLRGVSLNLTRFLEGGMSNGSGVGMALWSGNSNSVRALEGRCLFVSSLFRGKWSSSNLTWELKTTLFSLLIHL